MLSISAGRLDNGVRPIRCLDLALEATEDSSAIKSQYTDVTYSGCNKPLSTDPIPGLCYVDPASITASYICCGVW